MAHGAMEKFKEFLDTGDPDQIFVLEEEIASGSFGAVYKVRNNWFFLPTIFSTKKLFFDPCIPFGC